MDIDFKTTGRGFVVGKFSDHNGIKCSIQESSAIDFSDDEDESEDAIEHPGSSMLWLGVDDVEPKIMAHEYKPYEGPLAEATRDLRNAQDLYMRDSSNDFYRTKVIEAAAKVDAILYPTSFQRSGWIEYPIPKEVLLSSRMHLNRNKVKDLVSTLNHWLEHGELPENE